MVGRDSFLSPLPRLIMRLSSRTLLAIAGIPVALLAQNPPTPEPPETVAPGIAGVVAAGTKVRFIKGAFRGTEGPIGMSDGSLVFTETQANRLVRIDRNDSVTVFLENTNGANGLAIDGEGRLLSVQTTPGQTRIGVLFPKARVATLTADYQGSGYGRPNDLTAGKVGVFFTDPGPNVAAGQPAVPNPLPPAVYHLAWSGQVHRVADGIARPNGVLLSADEKTLYVANTNGEHVLAFDVGPDGALTNRRNFAKLEGVRTTETGVSSGADGLAIDSEGRLYVAANTGVQVFSARGEALGTIPIPRQPQNLAFAGPDKKTLYVVGRGSAYRIDMLSRGYAGRAK